MIQDLSDFYIKDENDPFYNDLKVENNTFIDTVISKLYVILMTNKGEVLGDPNFGADIPKYLWQTRFSATTLEESINEQISNYVPEIGPNDYTLNVLIIPGTVNDIGVIQINLGIANINILFR